MSAGAPISRAIAFILAAMMFISINDMIIKLLSGGYPLHQMVFLRSVIGICLALLLVQVEGGWHLLRTRRPGLHALRVAMIVLANLTFFLAISEMPLGLATAVFFVAPLFITLMANLVLDEPIGPRRLLAVLVGFVGVGVISLGGDARAEDTPYWVLGLPILAAFFYASMQILTRYLGAESQASAMAVYIQLGFLAVSSVFFLGAGDGRFASLDGTGDLDFLLRAWVWPAAEDLWKFAIIGVTGGVIGYALSQAYRLGPPATLAPFEYAALPMAIFWGWAVFGEVPSAQSLIGIGLIAAAGLYVFWRERHLR